MNKLIAWVKSYCKFAQVQPPLQVQKPAPASKLLSPAELNPIFEQIANSMKGALKQDADPSANFNAVKKQVTMSLQKALSQQGATIQDVQGSVDQIMKMLGMHQPAQNTQPNLQMQRPAPMQQGPKGDWEEPGLSQFRQNR